MCGESPPLGEYKICMSVGWWVASSQMTKILMNLDLMEIIQFCLNIYNLYRHPYPWIGCSVGQWVESGEITKNFKHLDLIKMIQFCLMQATNCSINRKTLIFMLTLWILQIVKMQINLNWKYEVCSPGDHDWWLFTNP